MRFLPVTLFVLFVVALAFVGTHGADSFQASSVGDASMHATNVTFALSILALVVLFLAFVGSTLSSSHFDLDHRAYGSKFEQIAFFLLIPLLCYAAFCYQYGVPPKFEFTFFAVVGCFMFVQWILYLVIPGQIKFGAVMHSGKRYLYKLNSFECLLINLALWVAAHHLGWWSGDFVCLQIDKFLLPLMVWGYVFSFGAFVKGSWWPSNSDASPQDDIIVDYVSGIEITPRFRDSPLDLKLFLIGHLGMNLWLLLNLNFVFFSYSHQHNFFSTLVLFLLQAIYIFDWAWHEEWYLHTIDIKQDRFGWILCFSPCTVIPCFYVSPCWFSSSLHSPEIDIFWTCFWALAFVGFYVLFRACNNQKDLFRKNNGNMIFCGQRLEGIKATYKGDDGVEHHTLLLASGFWGLSRHFNYFTDLCMCLCLSLIVFVRPTNLMDALMPHAYTMLMTYILVARQRRDDIKCAIKYGSSWKEYCHRVPFRIVPFMY